MGTQNNSLQRAKNRTLPYESISFLIKNKTLITNGGMLPQRVTYRLFLLSEIRLKLTLKNQSAIFNIFVILFRNIDFLLKKQLRLNRFQKEKSSYAACQNFLSFPPSFCHKTRLAPTYAIIEVHSP